MTTETGPEVPAKKSPCLNASMACERMLYAPCANFTSCRCPVPGLFPLFPCCAQPRQWAPWQEPDAHHVSAAGSVPCVPWSLGQCGYCPILFPGICQGLWVVPDSGYVPQCTHTLIDCLETRGWMAVFFFLPFSLYCAHLLWFGRFFLISREMACSKIFTVWLLYLFCVIFLSYR